jgi:uncharacterized protein YecE (DUF72 family)
MERAARLRVGTSGFHYEHWRERFYPADLARTEWFEFYARHFDTVEINNTFYRLPEPEVFAAWRDRAPKSFLYSLKFSRFATHLKRLKDPVEPVRRFVGRARRLGDRLGPILAQLPRNLAPDLERLRGFLEALDPEHRWVIEFRDRDWLDEAVFDLLRRHRVALCIHDLVPRHPHAVTADLVYLRFHGDRYRGSYSPQFLSAQARRIADHLAHGRDVYAYFNNDERAFAVENALSLRRYVLGE